jgi:hypothetical protein
MAIRRRNRIDGCKIDRALPKVSRLITAHSPIQPLSANNRPFSRNLSFHPRTLVYNLAKTGTNPKKRPASVL